MSVVRTNAAAAMLGVSPNTLRSWERRFGFPTPRRTQGGHRQFDLTEIEALRQAFAETQNISSAISIARERGEGPATPARLRDAFGRFDEDKADRLLEESLATRSVERTVEQVLLPTIEELPAGGAELAFAARRPAPGVRVCDFRGALPDTGASTVPRLGDEPLAARDALLGLLEARPASLERALRDLAQV